MLYLRVSTDQQNFNSQKDELHRYCERRGWDQTETVCDQVSGSRISRSGLDTLMINVRSGKVERIVVFKLDRLGRSLTHLALILDELQRHSVALVCTSQGIDTSNDNPVGRLQLTVLIAVAEFEREIIRERVNAGLAAAKSRGVRLGRRPTLHHRAKEVRALKADGLGLRRIARKLEMPISSVAAALRLGIESA